MKYNRISLLVLFLFWGTIGQTNAVEDKPDTRFYPTPINSAEAVLQVFWDPDTSDFSTWNVESGREYGLEITQNWAAVDFSWTAKPASGPALRMSKDIHADCSDYDRLVFSMAAPKEALVKITLTSDLGQLVSETPSLTGQDSEYVLDLIGAAVIETITIEVYPKENGEASGWINWILLQNLERLSHHLDQWNHFDLQWEKFIRDEVDRLSYKPLFGVFLNEDELTAFRELHTERIDTNKPSPFTAMAERAKSYNPEKAIQQFAQGTIRQRDNQHPQFSGCGVDAAVAGLVLKDRNLLRLAARHALSLAVCQYWDYGFTTQYPLSPWELRGFRQSYSSDDVARILDLAGEIFTTAGRRLILRKLSEEGVGSINYCTWRHDYIFDCNQLAFFNTGRMAAYLVLERAYPRVKPYTDIGYHESIENIERSILPDGGYYEGPGYFGSVIRRNCLILKQFANARRFDYATAIPDIVKRTGDYAAAIASTTENDNLAICDGDADGLDFDTLSVLATLLPESYWVTMYRKALERNQNRINDPFEILAERNIPKQGPELPPFVHLPETGYIASHRLLDGRLVKLFIMGNPENAGHCHEDKGSFILEFAGESFATDIGIGSYKDPLHHSYKHCQRHNMLVPIHETERMHPQNPLTYNVKPTGSGDETRFHAQIDTTPGWNGVYRKWIRRWDSPSPDRLTIEDEYELNEEKAVEFYWQTLLPCEIDDRTITINGKKGQAIVDAPSDCEIRIDLLPLQNGARQNRIAIRKNASSEKLKIDVTLETIPMSGR